MNYTEAQKKVWADKAKDNFMIVKVVTDYSSQLVVPYKEGVALLAALANAEHLREQYGEPGRIVGMPRDMLKTNYMSRQEYERYKIAALLNISPEEVLEMQQAADKPSP